jgi:Zn-dependent M28 family amino/carboxypeptidase
MEKQNMTAVAAEQALKQITAERLLKHIATLASDEFEGRKPGTEGEVRSTEYLMYECKKLGLDLGDALGGYLQKMPVVGVRGRTELCAARDGGTLTAKSLDDYVVRSAFDRHNTSVKDSPVVFVGYGAVAPEYGWDDYKGVDVRGKTVVMLIGDPQKRLSDGELDRSFFKGEAMTYYGRWTYKYEIAYEKGAAAVLIVHNTPKAGYGWDVVHASWGGENLFLAGDEKRCQIEGWIQGDFAEKLFSFGGKELAPLVEAAQHADFNPVQLDCRLNFDVENSVRRFNTSNVIAKIEGTHPRLKDECVIYCAHWDHFGKVMNEDGTVKGIYSGAADNGSGVATILEIARAFQSLPEPPKRSIYFLFTTLEESGLLGARYYVQNPAALLGRTMAILNFDSLNMWGRTRKIVSIAHGHSSCDQVLERYAAKQGRQVIPDQEPEKGYFFRSDHLEFLRKGVPALFLLNPGADYIDRPANYGVEKRAYFLQNDYHKFSDKVKPDWDLSGLVEDAQAMFLCGLDIANSDTRPSWNHSSEFAGVRDKLDAPLPFSS